MGSCGPSSLPKVGLTPPHPPHPPQWRLEHVEPIVDVRLRTLAEHCRHRGAGAHR